jgi:uncharacterized protein DUF3224
MRNHSLTANALVAAVCLSLGPAPSASPEHIADSHIARQDAAMVTARGTFDVKLTPQGTDDKADGSTLGRMSVEKQFHGDLEGTSKGEMLSAMTGVKDSAGYVAFERVSGTLNGRRGTFVLQHSGTMIRGTPQLTVTVVPDSATGELAGLSGRMEITIVDGKHLYEFAYTLALAP